MLLFRKSQISMVPKPFVVVEESGVGAEEVAGVVTTIEVEGVVDGAMLFDCTTPSKEILLI